MVNVVIFLPGVTVYRAAEAAALVDAEDWGLPSGLPQPGPAEHFECVVWFAVDVE